MKLQFTEAEINAGVAHAVSLMGFDLKGKTVTVDYSMGRGKNGLSAEVTITNPAIAGSTAAPAVVIPGFTDADDTVVTADPAPEAQPDTATTTEAAAPAGADAAALFGDDD